MCRRFAFIAALVAIVGWQNARNGFTSEIIADIQKMSVSPSIDDFGDRFINNVDQVVGSHHDELLRMSHSTLQENLTKLSAQEQAFLVGCWIRVRSDADEQLVEILKRLGLASPTFNLRMIDEVSNSEVRIRREVDGRMVDCDLFRFDCKNSGPSLIVLCCIPNASSRSPKLPARLRVSWWIGANYVSKLTLVSYRIERGWESSPFNTNGDD